MHFHALPLDFSLIEIILIIKILFFIGYLFIVHYTIQDLLHLKMSKIYIIKIENLHSFFIFSRRKEIWEIVIGMYKIIESGSPMSAIMHARFADWS